MNNITRNSLVRELLGEQSIIVLKNRSYTRFKKNDKGQDVIIDGERTIECQATFNLKIDLGSLTLDQLIEPAGEQIKIRFNASRMSPMTATKVKELNNKTVAVDARELLTAFKKGKSKFDLMKSITEYTKALATSLKAGKDFLSGLTDKQAEEVSAVVKAVMSIKVDKKPNNKHKSVS